jgi:hypothetical protein
MQRIYKTEEVIRYLYPNVVKEMAALFMYYGTSSTFVPSRKIFLPVACIPSDLNKVETHNVTGHRVTAQLLLSLTWGEKRFAVIHYQDHRRPLEIVIS